MTHSPAATDKPNDKPGWAHDCLDCQFLGRYDAPLASPTDRERYCDLYYCPRCDGGSVLARFGHAGPEYMSVRLAVLLYAGYNSEHPLVEAARRQISRWASARPSIKEER